ncbi:MAG: hypothetical protein M3014_11330, partial [Chloroflexota bacterium]|nr:hypothetical protein [Chloroflexota bacterium]
MDLRINVDLLKEILAIESYGDDDHDMLSAIKAKVEELRAENVHTEMRQDTYGNVYVVKGYVPRSGYYPCLVSHVDTVHPTGRHLTLVEED